MASALSRGVSSVDARIGDGIDALARAKRRRRLERLGRGGALKAGSGWWASGEPRPREGCQLEVLIDGATMFPRVAEAIGKARESIHVTGWHISPYFELVRGSHPIVLGEALAEAAERVDVRVLVWAGSPLPLFHPTRREVSAAVRELTRRTRIRCKPDPRERPLHCHHEKTIVIDGHHAFVGGIDMTDLAGDRFDTSDHPARRRLGWHDVSTSLHGPAVADVAGHFAMRWRELTGETLPPTSAPERAGDHTVQVVRTIAEGMYDEVPNGDFTVIEAYLNAISSAQRFVYLENQFLWAPEIVNVLAEKLQDPPTPDFRIVILLPSRANNGQDDTQGQLAQLEAADNGAKRLLAATVRSLSGTRDDRLYVHAKVGIVDDRWLTVGSANLNAHSLFNDTEMNVVTDDRDLARRTRIRLWSEHLQTEPESIADREPCEVVDEVWRPIAFEQLQRREAGAPATHRLLALPGISKRSRRLLGPLIGLIDDG